MTMALLDDETLGAFLHELGDSFPVPASGSGDTLRRVHRVDDERSETPRTDGEVGPTAPRLPHRVGRTIRSHRLLSAAAGVVVLLVLGGGAALLGHRTPPPRTTVAERALHTPPSATRQAPGAAAGTSTKAAGSASGGATAGTGAGTANKYSAVQQAPLNAAASGAPSSNAHSTQSAGTLPAGAVGQPAKIEQTGSLDLTVAAGALAQSMTKLASLATTYGGFVANSQTQSGSAGNPPSGTVTLQIPVANFGAALKATEALGRPSALTTKATDVTSQYVDLQSRITALQASRQQYLTIMTKASSIGDVLAVQAQLDGLQSQIEQLQGQLAVLNSETAYSTLTASVGEPGPHHHHVVAPSESGALKAWHDSVHGFAAGVDGIIRIAGPALFALLCLAALLLGGRLTWRRLQRHNL
jgi:hypothetical protein